MTTITVAEANALTTANPTALTALRAYCDNRTTYNPSQRVRIAQMYCLPGATPTVMSLMGDFADRLFAAEFMLANPDMFPTSFASGASVEYAYVLETSANTYEFVVL